ncbi:MAG: hypothetical protein WD739_11040 [Actinomycetota bacterium]
MTVQKAATVHVSSDGDRWRLHDDEGVAQGTFHNLEGALSAARYIAKERAPSCIKVQDQEGAWKIVERFEDPSLVIELDRSARRRRSQA